MTTAPASPTAQASPKAPASPTATVPTSPVPPTPRPPTPILRTLVVVFSFSFFLLDFGVDVVLGAALRRLAYKDDRFPRRQGGEPSGLGGQIAYGLGFGNDSMFGDSAPYFRGFHFLVTWFWLLAGVLSQVILVVVVTTLRWRHLAPEWRIAVAATGLFFSAPNLLYCHALWFTALGTPESEADALRSFRVASLAKLAPAFFSSVPQIVTQTVFASANAFNEGYENMAPLQRLSVLSSCVGISAAVANFVYERRGCATMNVFSSPNYHSLSSAFSVFFFCLSELAVLSAFCRMACFCGVCLSTLLVPVMLGTAMTGILALIFSRPEHDWTRRFCSFIGVKGLFWFLAFILEKQLISSKVLESELTLNGADDSLYANLWIFVPINLFWGSCLFFTDNRWTAGFSQPLISAWLWLCGAAARGLAALPVAAASRLGAGLGAEFRALSDDAAPVELIEDAPAVEEPVDEEGAEEGENISMKSLKSGKTPDKETANKQAANKDATGSTQLSETEGTTPAEILASLPSEKSHILVEETPDGPRCDAMRAKMAAALVISVVGVVGIFVAVCSLALVNTKPLYPDVIVDVRLAPPATSLFGNSTSFDGVVAGFAQVSLGRRSNFSSICLHPNSDAAAVAAVVCRQLGANDAAFVDDGVVGLDFAEVGAKEFDQFAFIYNREAAQKAENLTEYDKEGWKDFKIAQFSVVFYPYIEINCDGTESHLGQCGLRFGLEIGDDCYKCFTKIFIYDQQNGQPTMDAARRKEIEICVRQNERQLFVQCGLGSNSSFPQSTTDATIFRHVNYAGEENEQLNIEN